MIFLIEFGVHDGVAASTIYVSTHGIASGPTDTPANKFYEPRLSSVGRLERSMFANGDGVSGGTTGGASEVGFGNISVLNGQSSGVEELIDDWKDLAFREVTIKSLSNDAQPFSQAVTRFIGTVEQLVSTNALERYDMIIHDRLENLNKPLLINKYLGTTTYGGLGTAEGDEDQKDQIKQKIWGTVHNVNCVDVNHFDLVWQVSDGQVLSITVYDGGVALTNAGDIGSIEALFAVAIEPGHYATCCALGLFRTGSSVQGSVTADVVEGNTASDRTAAQIVNRMLAWFADMYDETLSLSSSDAAALDALNPAECGIVVKDTENALTAIMRVLNSVGAWMLPQSNSLSMYEVGRFDPPDVLPVATYELNENIGGNPQRVESGDDGKGVPAWKVTVRYDQLDVVQKSSDLFGVVTENDPIRVQYLATEWRQASAEDDTVLVQWPNAPTIEVDTRLISQADAAAEAARLLAIHGVKRDIWRIVVPMSDDPADDPGIGEVVELTSALGRMGLGPEPGLGQTYRCLGRIDDFDNVPLLTLTLWGPFGLPNMAFALSEPEPEPEPIQTIEARFAGAGSLRADATVTTFTPADLPGLVAWYKADAGVYSDAGMTTLATDGQAVLRWADQSGHGYTLISSTTPPTYGATGFNGRKTVNFPALTLGFVTTTSSVVMGTGNTMSGYIVGQVLSGTGAYARGISYAEGLSADFNVVGSACIILTPSSSSIASYRTVQLSTQTISTATNYRMGSIFDGANNTIYLNNVAATPAASVGNWASPGRFIVGYDSNGTQSWVGPMSEIVVTNTALSSTERTNLDNYFKAKWGL